MSLILAIEPNKNQAHQLSALVRAHLKAELVTAPTAAAALSALGDRIPDVVLTPALFGLRDEAALTERLRQLGSDAAHVQTLAIPILAGASSKSGGASGGLLGRKKDKADSNVGCDPAVFAEQIRIYLQRASVERRAQASEAAARAMATTRSAAANASAEPAEDVSAFMVSADELDVDSLSIDLPEPSAPAPRPQPQNAAVPLPPVDDAQQRNRKPPQTSPNPIEEELGLVTPPASGPPLWRVAESVEDYYGHGDAIANAVSTADMSVEPFPEATETSPRPAGHHAAPSVPRPRRTPPQPDDWTYFDPSQSTFKALIRRLDEIAGSAA
jgi:hypothetical protein